MSASRGATPSGGGGATPRSSRSSTRALAALRERIGELQPWPRRARLTRLSCPRPSRCPRRWSTRSAPSSSPPTTEDRLRHAAGRGYVDLARMRTAGWRRRRTRSCCPADAEALRRVLDVCAARGCRRRPVRRRHQRRRRGRAAARRPLARHQPRPGAPARRRGRPPLADRAPRRRPARPGGRGGARRAGPDPRPLPAVVRVRDDRRLRRDPLGRPGLERLRPLRRAGQLGAADRPGRRDGDAGDAAHRRRPGPARADRRLRGRPRRDPRRDRAGPPGAGGAPLRGLDGGELRGRGGDRPGAGPGTGPARRDPHLRRGGDRGSRWRSRGRAGRRQPLRRATWGCAGAAAAPGDRRLRGRRGVGRAPPGALGPGAARAAAPPTSARPPGAPGSTAATRAPTCATR